MHAWILLPSGCIGATPMLQGDVFKCHRSIRQDAVRAVPRGLELFDRLGRAHAVRTWERRQHLRQLRVQSVRGRELPAVAQRDGLPAVRGRLSVPRGGGGTTAVRGGELLERDRSIGHWPMHNLSSRIGLLNRQHLTNCLLTRQLHRCDRQPRMRVLRRRQVPVSLERDGLHRLREWRLLPSWRQRTADVPCW